MADTANRSRGSGRRVRGAFVPEARCGYRNPTLSSILATQMPCRSRLHPKRKNRGSKTLPLFFGQASDCHRDLSGLFLPHPFFAGVQDLCRHHPAGVSGKAYYVIMQGISWQTFLAGQFSKRASFPHSAYRSYCTPAHLPSSLPSRAGAACGNGHHKVGSFLILRSRYRKKHTFSTIPTAVDVGAARPILVRLALGRMLMK